MLASLTKCDPMTARWPSSHPATVPASRHSSCSSSAAVPTPVSPHFLFPRSLAAPPPVRPLPHRAISSPPFDVFPTIRPLPLSDLCRHVAPPPPPSPRDERGQCFSDPAISSAPRGPSLREPRAPPLCGRGSPTLTPAERRAAAAGRSADRLDLPQRRRRTSSVVSGARQLPGDEFVRPRGAASISWYSGTH